MKPRICFVNTHDTVGGAERCSFDLMTGLRARGQEVALVVGRKFSNDPDVFQCVYPQWDWRPMAFLNNRVGLTDTTLFTPLRMLTSTAFRCADVVNIHNMHGKYWNFWTLPLEATRKPVVLTLHDEWFLTGDCAYTYRCERWLDHCGSCPQFAWTIRPALGGRDLTAVNLWLKRAAASLTSAERLTIVTPSEWLAGQVRRAPHLRRFRQITIPNGIDTQVFRPRDKAAAKAKFGVPSDKFCFLFFAHNLDDPRKGGPRLERTLAEHGLPENSILLLAGKGGEAIAAKFPDLPIRLLGYLDSRDDVATCLSGADCLLLLAAADNLPYAGIEAIACGCGVLALDVGGIREIVEPGRSGWLLPADADAGQLASEMSQLARSPAAERQRLGGAARDLAVERFSMDRFLQRYEALFQEEHEKHLRSSTPQRRKEAQPLNKDKFERDIVKYAQNPDNQERFARLLNSILPTYVKWTWGQDDIYRRHFNNWQRSGFNLAPNHYYSPIPDVLALPDRALSGRTEMVGIDMRETEQMTFLDVCATFRNEYSRFPAHKGKNPSEFHFDNGAFTRVDAEVLHTMVRHYKPRRFIEIGGGYSTLIAAAAGEANRSEDGSNGELVVIEPFPNDLFRNPIAGLTRLVPQPVQRVGLDLFEALEENDILFIDSSHVLKVGGDVQYEYLEILPRLKRGVVVHVHDIFLPGEYPNEWVREEHVFWNEQYLLQAFLSFNDSFEVLWAGSFMHRKHPEKLAECFPGYHPASCHPGSFWMRKTR